MNADGTVETRARYRPGELQVRVDMAAVAGDAVPLAATDEGGVRGAAADCA